MMLNTTIRTRVAGFDPGPISARDGRQHQYTNLLPNISSSSTHAYCNFGSHSRDCFILANVFLGITVVNPDGVLNMKTFRASPIKPISVFDRASIVISYSYT